MTPNGLSQEQRNEGGAPAASLTLVRVQRRRSTLQPSRKAGDLTQRLMDEKALAPATPAPSTPLPVPEPVSLASPAEDTGAVIALPGPNESFAPAPDEAAPASITVADPEPAMLAPADEPEPPAPPAFLPIAEPQP